MKFLIRHNGKKKAAHLWRGNDTFCTMYSTGGLKKRLYSVYDEPFEYEICHMCNNNYKKVTGHRFMA